MITSAYVVKQRSYHGEGRLAFPRKKLMVNLPKFKIRSNGNRNQLRRIIIILFVFPLHVLLV